MAKLFEIKMSQKHTMSLLLLLFQEQTILNVNQL